MQIETIARSIAYAVITFSVVLFVSSAIYISANSSVNITSMIVGAGIGAITMSFIFFIAFKYITKRYYFVSKLSVDRNKLMQCMGYNK